MRKQRARGGKRGIISAKYSVSKHLLGRVWRQWLGMCAIFHTVDTGYLQKEDSMVWRWAWDTKNPYAEAYGFQFGVADGARTHDNRNHNPGLYQLSYSHHKTFGTPDRNRTCNPRLRRSVLYPVELRALMPIRAKNFLVGAVGFELTTLCSQSRCANQTALRPDKKGEFYSYCFRPVKQAIRN